MHDIFSEREQGFEAKYVHDQETLFRIRARRDHLFGLWAARTLGYDSAAAEAYAQALVAVDVHPERGDQALVRVIRDLGGKLGEAPIRSRFAECAEQARHEIGTRGSVE